MAQVIILQNKFTSQSEKQAGPEAFGMRRSEKFLRSFGKEWEAKLPTYPLIINENTQKLRSNKKMRRTSPRSSSELAHVALTSFRPF